MTAEPLPDPDARAAVRAMWQRAHALGTEGRFRDQVTCVDEIQRRFADSSDPEVRATALRTLAGQMHAAFSAGEGRLGRAVTQRMAEALETELDPVVRVAVAETTLEMATMLAFAPLGSSSPITCLPIAWLGRLPSLRRRARVRAAGARRELILNGLALAQRLSDTLADSTVLPLQSVAVQAEILVGAAHALLGQWQRIWPSFEPLFTDGGTRVGRVIDNARARPDGRFRGTEISAAIIAQQEHIADQSRAQEILQSRRRRWP
ncbi:MAG TPA: hypothetical protein VMF07_11935 [Solirubrobacteraceae bacterium]|nr:hypothetical protein [Solirubrobacteraceae bacterium]